MHGREMTGTFRQTTWRGRSLLAAPLLLASLVAGCSNGGIFGGPAASPPEAAASPPSGLVSPIAGFLSGSSARAPQIATGAQPDINCPPVDVRRGASTLTIGPTGDKTAMTLKYQAEFIREARECAVVGGNMVMKIGIEGRVIVGPGGGPGQVDVPLRMAIVQETPSSGTRAVQTKFMVIPVVIGPGQGGASFSHVEDAITFPLPTPTAQLDDYIVYVGFDPQTAAAQPRQPPKARPRPKHPAASTD